MEAQDFLEGRTPLGTFQAWLEEAKKPFKSKDGTAHPSPRHAEAMTLSTVDKNGVPSSRVVLLKEFRDAGFVFYTNYESRKGHEIADHKQVAINFYWDALHRQVCFRGTVEKISREDSQKYWDSRARASQLSQWVSKQSTHVNTRAQMEEEWALAETKFNKQPVPLPAHWGGYLFKPTYVEFWLGRDGRFHDRYVFTAKNSAWTGERLYP